MKFQLNLKIKTITIALCAAGFITIPAMSFSAVNSDDAKIKRLEEMVNHLQKEVHALKRNRSVATQTVSGSDPVAHQHSKHTAADPVAPTSDTEPQHKINRADLLGLIREERQFLPFDLDVPGQAFVSTGPYVGVPLQFSGTNLVVNSPSVNTDLQLLDIRRKIVEQLHAMGGEIAQEPYHSHLLLSGVVEGQAGYLKPSHRRSSSDIDVTDVALDAFFIGPSNWTLGFIEFMYDNATPSNSPYGATPPNSYRVSNSRLYVNKAFVTVGDFTKSPLYGSLGQMYVPYGTYSSIMITDTMTKLIGRTKARALLLGFEQQSKNGFYGSGFAFRGDTRTKSSDTISNGGVNLAYKFSYCDFLTGRFGGSWIANIADSGGLQRANGFSSFERIKHRVPGYNARGVFSLGSHVDIIAEYITSARRFAKHDMSFNQHGAKPWAVDTEASYSFTIFDNKPASIGVGYQRSGDSVALGLPRDRYSLVGNTSMWRNTLEALEIRRDREFSKHIHASGADGSFVDHESGGKDYAVTAQIDYYF